MSEFTFDLDKPLEPAVSEVKKVLEPDVAFPLRHGKGMYDDIVAFLRSPEPFRTLEYEARLLQIPDFNWCHGSWTIAKEKGGWRDELSDRFVFVEQVREAIERRIRDLGLDRDLIEAYGAPRPYQEPTVENCGAALRRLINEQSWASLPFDERMQRFRRREGSV
jgi:hypothetical protein